MKRILAVIIGGVLIGTLAAHAKLPPAPQKSEEEKAAEAQKAAATKAKEAEALNRAMEKAVANHKRNAATMDQKK